MRKYVSYLLVLILFVSCKEKARTKNILPLNTMKFALWDILKADEWYTQTTIRDTLHKRLNENFQIYEQVFKIHNISKSQFYSSYKFYESHPDQFKTLIDSVIAVGDRDKFIEKKPANPK